ncbi:MAG: hypothetical protein PHD49_02360 [Candidatus Shapirobacteria bacterium]|nr:hypothetical protein [Candidatus Shapirobacteria bacterium]
MTFILMFLVVFPKSVMAMNITIGVSDKYSEVNAGEKIYFETEIKWPENVDRKDLKMEYFITDNNGKEIAYLKVLKAVTTQAIFSDSILIPEGTPKGMYKISLKINDYKELNQDAVVSFNVIKTVNKNTLILYIIVGQFILTLFYVVFELPFLIKRLKSFINLSLNTKK